MIDIGVNLSNKQFSEDLVEVVERAATAGVSCLILTSTDKDAYDSNLKIAERLSSIPIAIRATYGFHPNSDRSKLKKTLEHADEAMSNPIVSSIGEFGLDYFRKENERKTQIEAMESLMELANKHPEKSLFLHERAAFDDFLPIIRTKNDNKAVVHCFTGGKREAHAYLDAGCMIGITGWISDPRRNSELAEAVESIPLDKIMIETDCPYLTPYNMPKRPRRNEPAFLRHIAESVAVIKKISLEEASAAFFRNSVEFFAVSELSKDFTKGNKP